MFIQHFAIQEAKHMPKDCFKPYPKLFEALSRAKTFVDVGIHHLDLLNGGKDLSAGGNCLIVVNCNKFLKIALNLEDDRVLNQ